jgi:hypothetical protein
MRKKTMTHYITRRLLRMAYTQPLTSSLSFVGANDSAERDKVERKKFAHHPRQVCTLHGFFYRLQVDFSTCALKHAHLRGTQAELAPETLHFCAR